MCVLNIIFQKPNSKAVLDRQFRPCTMPLKEQGTPKGGLARVMSPTHFVGNLTYVHALFQ